MSEYRILQEVDMDDSDRLSALRKELVSRLGRERYDLWLGPQSSLDLSNGKLRVGCSSTFELQCLRRRVHAQLVETCRVVCGENVSVEYFICAAEPVTTKMVQKQLIAQDDDVVDEAGVVVKEPWATAEAAATTVCESPAPRIHSIRREAKKQAPGGRTLSRCSFNNFVVGAGNELAFRTAHAIAERPGRYGTLVLHGPSGSGKTHLQFALLRELRRQGSSLRSLRLTAEQFTAEFLDALHHRTSPSFRQKYRSVDVLMIDDIQFLLTKRATLDELLVTIDSLQERGKQVVLTCDCSPQELLKVSPELSSRISGGLTIPLEMPDFATRQGLVRQFIADMHPVIGMTISDEIVVVIATQVAGSARQLQGAINKLIVTSQALKKPLSAELARTILAEYVQQITPVVKLSDIQRAVCEVFGVEATSLKSASKTRTVVEPRMLAMWLACNLTRSALGEISEFFGRRSHSTVISAQKKIERMVSEGEHISVANHDCSVEEAIRKVQQLLRRA
jgi:chromosomal replication initiator protein